MKSHFMHDWLCKGMNASELVKNGRDIISRDYDCRNILQIVGLYNSYKIGLEKWYKIVQKAFSNNKKSVIYSFVRIAPLRLKNKGH